jgi:hypothetical protein
MLSYWNTKLSDLYLNPIGSLRRNSYNWHPGLHVIGLGQIFIILQPFVQRTQANAVFFTPQFF